MRTRASIAKHPIHPMLVVVPLGALPTALVLDLVHLARPGEAWDEGALVATLFGLGGMFLAIGPGAWDYAKSVPRAGDAWALASRHMLLGLTLLAVFTLVAILRLAPVATSAWLQASYLALHAAGVIGLALQAWWGAGLVMRNEVGVEVRP